jgi:hypothetical protein
MKEMKKIVGCLAALLGDEAKIKKRKTWNGR